MVTLAEADEKLGLRGREIEDHSARGMSPSMGPYVHE
jgi:hypothetical protein